MSGLNMRWKPTHTSENGFWEVYDDNRMVAIIMQRPEDKNAVVIFVEPKSYDSDKGISKSRMVGDLTTIVYQKSLIDAYLYIQKAY